MTTLARVLRPLYLRTRAAVRHLVVDHPTIDLTIGRSLVQVDLLLRRLGLVSAMDADAREFPFDGCRFAFDPANRELAIQILTTGEYETATLAAIRARVPPDGGLVDLGANLGFFSVLIARDLGPTGRVYAFEPTPATAALLRANVATNGVADRVSVIEQAVADHPGTAQFSLYAGAQANQLASAGAEGAVQTIEVVVMSLDVYFALHGWPRVDVIKMDIEGAEIAALDGMRELVRRNPGLSLIFEYHRGQLDRAGVRGEALIDRVHALGFNRFAMLFRGQVPIDLPADHARLDRQARRGNLNLLAWRE